MAEGKVAASAVEKAEEVTGVVMVAEDQVVDLEEGMEVEDLVVVRVEDWAAED